MGATFSSRRYEGALSREAIEARWKEDVAGSLFESGHSYSGDIGMLGAKIAKWVDKDFDSLFKAEDWLVANHEKYEPAIAVSYIESTTKAKMWVIGGWCSS